MRTIDRCILTALAIGVWVLSGILLFGPEPALSQSAEVSNLMSLASTQISRVECQLNGTSSGAAITGIIHCHL